MLFHIFNIIFIQNFIQFASKKFVIKILFQKIGVNFGQNWKVIGGLTFGGSFGVHFLQDPVGYFFRTE